MKFLISVKPNPNVPTPAPEQMAGLLQGFVAEVRGQLSRGELICAFGTGQGEGFAIADTATTEDAWKLAARNPLFPLWNVEVTALTDPIVLTEALLEIAQSRQRELAAV